MADVGSEKITAARRIACAHCGTAFDCALSTECWCAADPVRLPMPAAGAGEAGDCVCPACLRALEASSNAGDRM